MGEKLSKKRAILIEKLDLPKDVVLDVPKIIVTGKEEITIENHKGILTFNEYEIRINSKLGPVSIKGDNFEILYIATSTMTVSGKFSSISYEEWLIWRWIALNQEE